MFERDTDQFTALLEDAFALNPNWKPLSPKGKALFFRALEPYSLEVVSRAMTAHIRDPKRGSYQPTPADIVGQIEAASGMDGRPGAEEAWALCLPAISELETVVWTAEMRDAFGTCRTVLERGDEVGARMAFKEAYTRMAADAVRNGRPVKWEISIGHDAQKREKAITHAVNFGRLPAPQVAGLLPAPVSADPHGLAKVKAMLQNLVPGSEKAAQKREIELQALREQKRQIDEQVAKRKGNEHE